MPKIKTFSLAFFAGVGVILAAQASSAKTTVAVGTCQPQLVSYSTISEAVAAVTPHSTVLVCPGTYPEQVTINTPLTLEGLVDADGVLPVITVPSGGVVANDGQAVQVFAGGAAPTISPVNISNLVVDGTGSGIDCSTSTLVGIEYSVALGSLMEVEVRNQAPGGCGYAIVLVEGTGGQGKINIKNSYIHDFDNTGISGASFPDNLTLNLTSNMIASALATMQAGVGYGGYSRGLATENIIAVSGQTGLVVGPETGPVTVNGNTISGSNVGILVTGLNAGSTIINNRLSNNGTGILLYEHLSETTITHVVKSNMIAQSTTAAIDLGCSEDVDAKHNTISDAPVGIANITSGDIVKLNTFSDVTTPTTTCPSQSQTLEHQPWPRLF